MSGYFGTDIQRALQKLVFESLPTIAATRGLCNSGRLIATDQPEALGADTLKEMMASNGVLGFRVLNPIQFKTHIAPFESQGNRIDTWDVFMADVREVRDRVDAIV